jgi:1-acyl-sn-glycerol-3-phosphate acyltransferase
MWISKCLIALIRFVIGATARWESPPDLSRQRIYFANHTSHMDTLVVIAALPPEARRDVKPIAAADYWGKNRFLSYISQNVLNAALIERHPAPGQNALEPVFEAVRAGHSIIIFPEGTRSTQPLPGEFKSGLYRLHQSFPDVELVPIYLENLHRSMPKGKHVPLPILCTIRIGNPLNIQGGEDKEAFLQRAREAIMRLSK